MRALKDQTENCGVNRNCYFYCRIETKRLTVEEKVSSLGLAVREEGGVFRQEAVGARLIVFSIVIRSVAIYIDCKIKDTSINTFYEQILNIQQLNI